MSREFDLEEFNRDKRAYSSWNESDHTQETEDTPSESNPLSDLLVFLSDAYHTGSLTSHALAFLWVFRPDLLMADLKGGTVDEIARKAGLTGPQLNSAVRKLRETVPEIDQVMRQVQTSRTRFLALAKIKARRRLLNIKDREAIAEARIKIAPERVRKSRKKARDFEARKRLRAARQVLALADPLFKAAAEDMRAFDRSMGLRP